MFPQVKYTQFFRKEEGYEALYRRLTNQPLTPPPDIGTPKQLPPRERAQLVFGNTQPDETQQVTENRYDEGSKELWAALRPPVPPPSVGTAKASYFYAREDERLRREFETHLALLQQYLRQQGIDVDWHGYMVKSGRKIESHQGTCKEYPGGDGSMAATYFEQAL